MNAAAQDTSMNTYWSVVYVGTRSYNDW